jgi:enolase-phosphatase E1
VSAAAAGAVLVDIEGTTTPVAFVHDVLFPYARRHLEGFLHRHAADPVVQGDLETLRRERAAEPGGAAGMPPAWEAGERACDPALAYLRWLMDRDRKSTALKALQGRIWQDGYRSGELRSSVYPDVPPAFRRWHQRGAGPWIFSSGSVLAQQLLFAHTGAGDLTPWIAGYFDTTTGPKKEPPTYARIAAVIGAPAEEILFVSDVAAEVDAARAAGFRTALCAREGAVPPTAHPVLRSFEAIS